MGPTKRKREALKKASHNKNWAAQVDRMTDEHVDSIYNKLHHKNNEKVKGGRS